MINPLKKVGLFLAYFLFFTGTSISLFYFFKDTAFKRQMHILDLTHKEKTCPESPEKFLFQECLRPKINKLSSIASPLEVLRIPNLLESYHQQDLSSDQKNLNKADMAYIINQVVFYESLKNYSIRRDSIDFFQIILLPILRWRLGEILIKTKENNQLVIEKLSHEEFSPVEKRYIERFNQLKIIEL